MAAPRPRYDDLPVRPGAPPGSSWGVWGDGDRLGTLNLLDAAAVLRGREALRRGRVFPLDLPFGEPDPPLFGRAAAGHRLTADDEAFARDDVISGWNTQAASQWDGFRHVRDLEHGYYNGLPGPAHGVAEWARRGLAGRAVLADVARHLAAEGRPLDPATATPITVDDLRGCLRAQGVAPEQGDILLVRTGWLAHYRALDADGRRRAAVKTELRAPGLLAAEETARWLWDSGFAAVAADNPSLEAWPLGAGAAAGEPILHIRLLARLGMPIGELWDLDALARDCAETGEHTAFLVSAPMPLAAGCGSPANAVAMR
jgi:kynurenine formamidase